MTRKFNERELIGLYNELRYDIYLWENRERDYYKDRAPRSVEHLLQILATKIDVDEDHEFEFTMETFTEGCYINYDQVVIPESNNSEGGTTLGAWLLERGIPLLHVFDEYTGHEGGGEDCYVVFAFLDKETGDAFSSVEGTAKYVNENDVEVLRIKGWYGSYCGTEWDDSINRVKLGFESVFTHIDYK